MPQSQWMECSLIHDDSLWLSHVRWHVCSTRKLVLTLLLLECSLTHDDSLWLSHVSWHVCSTTKLVLSLKLETGTFYKNWSSYFWTGGECVWQENKCSPSCWSWACSQTPQGPPWARWPPNPAGNDRLWCQLESSQPETTWNTEAINKSRLNATFLISRPCLQQVLLCL